MDQSSATERARAAGLNLWTLRGRTLLPVVQGGMGVGVSAGRLAGTVASFGAVGTISSVDLRRLHPDLMEATGQLEGPGAKPQIDAANREALQREIRRGGGRGRGRGRLAGAGMRGRGRRCRRGRFRRCRRAHSRPGLGGLAEQERD